MTEWLRFKFIQQLALSSFIREMLVWGDNTKSATWISLCVLVPGKSTIQKPELNISKAQGLKHQKQSPYMD